MKKILMLALIYMITIGNVNTNPSNQITTENVENLNSSLGLNAAGTVVHDGIISPGEYEYKVEPYLVDKNGMVMNLHYYINRSIIYFALEADVGGWISIGFDYSNKMADSDMVVGWHNEASGITTVSDKWGISNTGMPVGDVQQDILSFAGSQTTGPNHTIIEFSRYLDTGDTAQDNEIIPGVPMKLLWAVHESADMYTLNTEHTQQGKYKHPSTNDNFVTFLGSPSTPKSISIASENENQVDLSWIASAGDGGFAINHYNIYRKIYNRTLDAWSNYSKIDTTTSTNSYSDTTITAGENYTYMISAENIKGESGYSNEIDAFPYGVLTTPLNLVTVLSSWQVGLEWNYPASDGGVSVDKYYIYRSSVSVGPYNLLGETTNLYYNDTEVINGLSYYYVISGENRLSTSNLTSEVIGEPVGESTPPLNLVITSGDNNTTLSWDAPSSDGGYVITSYSVYRSDTINGTYLSIISTADPSYIDLDVMNAQTYYYRTTATNSFGESGYSAIQQVTLANVPTTPLNLIVNSSEGGIQLNWDAADGKGYNIDNYNIYRSIKINGKYTLIDTMSTTDYFDTSVQKGVTYYYKISASNVVGEGGFSLIDHGTSASKPSEPRSLSTIIGEDRIKIMWVSVSDDGGYIISYYNVYRSIGEGFELLGISYPKEYIDKDVVAGVEYSYKITAVNKLGEGNYSIVISGSIFVQPTTPDNLVFQLNYDGVMLSWESNESEFNIYRSTISGQPYTLLGNTNNLNYSDTSIEFGYTYYYVISSQNSYAESNLSIEIEIDVILLPETPKNLIGLAGDEQGVLFWESPFDGGSVILGYNIYRSNSLDGEFEFINSTSTIMYIDETVENNVTYYYKVSTVTSYGLSELTEAISITPLQSAMKFEIIAIDNPNSISPDDKGVFTSEDLASVSVLVVVEGEDLEIDQIGLTSGVIIVMTTGIVGLNLIGKKITSP